MTTFFGFNALIATPGRIQRIEDRYGSAQTFVWQNVAGMVQVASVTDSYGRTVNYRYYGSEVGFRLREIEDFLGRKLNFQYDTDGRLTAVVTPSINNAVVGNTFRGGTAYVFQYDSANPRPQRRDDLIKIWYPNQATPFIDTATRTVNVAGVYASATPRYSVTYGQDPTDVDQFGKVVAETVGDIASGVGGTYTYLYVTTGLPSNLIDPYDPIVSRAVVTDRNGNQITYDFTSAAMLARKEVFATRTKNSLEAASYVTWASYNHHNQPLLQIMPEGNSIEYEYEDGTVSGITGTYAPRDGLLLRRTELPGNSLGIPSRSGSNGQTELTQRWFYDPLYNRTCALIERRGNPVAASSTYFTPQNGGTTPTNSDRSRYATITYFDFQKDAKATVQADTVLQAQLGLSSAEIGSLVDHVNGQMTDSGGSGGIPAGFEMNLGDINGDGSGSGASSGLPDASHVGNVVKLKHPSVLLVGGTSQTRVELFTTNLRGQQTTSTDPEGNLTVYVRYPENDPDGNGLFTSSTLSGQQYGLIREVHTDADPNDVMNLVGSEGDLLDFVGGLITRTNTPGVYQDLVTRTEGNTNCGTCAYDPLGNALSSTDARGFTTTYDRNELGRVYRTTSPAPYNFKVETSYDANGNVIQVDTEDQQVAFASTDPTDADFAKFLPSGNNATAHVPMTAGPGGSVRPGWFSNLFSFDLLNNKVEEDIDATGSNPPSLVTKYLYDPNQNLIQVTKPEMNLVEYDYNERDLRIATRVGYDPSITQPGALTVTAYDKNGNVMDVIGPAQRGTSDNSLTVIIDDAFRSGSALTHTGDWVAENTYDGFDRIVNRTDAVGNTAQPTYDPDGRAIETLMRGPVGGATPTDRTGSANEDLASNEARFDEAGRPYESQRTVFLATGTTLPSGRAITHIGGGLAINSTANNHTGTVTLTSSGTSYVLSRTVFDCSGRVSQLVEDNIGFTTLAYDGANRAISSIDALGNIVTTACDGNGNAINVIRTDKDSGDPLGSRTLTDETFTSSMRYDSHNRLIVIRMQGPSSNGTDDLYQQFSYDSRGNNTLAINPKGNTSVTVYDGASRSTETRQHLRRGGEGLNPPEDNQSFTASGRGLICTRTTYDGNGRMTQLIDDRGTATVYTYDTLDRQITMTFADASLRTSGYNAASDMATYTDENGSVFVNTFDPRGRKISVAITLAMNVEGTTAQTFEYDGLSRRTFARDTVSSANADVTFVYDSLSRTLEDSQVYAGNTRNLTHDQFVSYPHSRRTLPSGTATHVTETHDALYRLKAVGGDVGTSTWRFMGQRIVEQVLGNNLACTQLNNARTHSAVQSAVANPGWGDHASDRLGYDGAGRMITKRFVSTTLNGSGGYSNTTALVGFTSSFDPSSNKFYERALHVESRSALYPDYDSADRLLEYQRGTLASMGTMVTTPISLPNTNKQQDYDLDGLGNWKETIYTAVGSSATTQVRRHNYLNEVIRYGSAKVLYDHGNNAASADALVSQRGNGNIINDGTLLLAYDALNRVTTVKRQSDSDTIAAYTYDAKGRRIRKVVTNGGATTTVPNGTTDYLYDGVQCIEERDGSNAVLRQYSWGQYVDEAVAMKTLVTTGPQSLAAGIYYPLSDLLYRTAALTNTSVAVVEAYDTDAYGNTLLFKGPGTDGLWFTDDDVAADYAAFRYIFTGREYDAETRIYFYRARYYQPSLGRFTSRDPLTYASDINLYSYTSGCPIISVDADGRKHNRNPDGSPHIPSGRHRNPDGSPHIPSGRHANADGSRHIPHDAEDACPCDDDDDDDDGTGPGALAVALPIAVGEGGVNIPADVWVIILIIMALASSKPKALCRTRTRKRDKLACSFEDCYDHADCGYPGADRHCQWAPTTDNGGTICGCYAGGGPPY